MFRLVFGAFDISTSSANLVSCRGCLHFATLSGVLKRHTRCICDIYHGQCSCFAIFIMVNVHFSRLRICKALPPSPLKWPSLPKRCAMCWNERKIIYQIFPIFSFWVIGHQRATHFAKTKLFKSRQACREYWDWSDNDFSHKWFFLCDS